MSDAHGLPADFDRPRRYTIRIDGHLDARWTGRFEGPIITLDDDGTTVLTAPVADQAALHGWLKTIRDLGMLLISVSPLEQGPADESQFNRRI